jgi:1,4-dihydroxy-2-naphthoyl-CoA hydrolase
MTYTLPDSELTPERFNTRGARALPGHIGMVVTHAARPVRGVL